MNERKLSELQKEYRTFFLEKMSFYGVKSPSELSKEKKSEFFTEIKQDWAQYKFTKKQLKEFEKEEVQIAVNEPLEIYIDQSTQEGEKKSSLTITEGPQNKPSSHSNKGKEQEYTQKTTPRQEDERPSQARMPGNPGP